MENVKLSSNLREVYLRNKNVFLGKKEDFLHLFLLGDTA
jgi:hypothetical protein